MTLEVEPAGTPPPGSSPDNAVGTEGKGTGPSDITDKAKACVTVPSYLPQKHGHQCPSPAPGPSHALLEVGIKPKKPC